MRNMSLKGFTLVELLVVIAIIGLLLSVVIGSISNSRLKSRDNKRIADIKQLQLALTQFFDACNGYPASLQSSSGVAGCVYTLGQFIAEIPVDPSTNAPYDYNPSNTCVGAQIENATNLTNQIQESQTCNAGSSGTNSDTDVAAYNPASNHYTLRLH